MIEEPTAEVAPAATTAATTAETGADGAAPDEAAQGATPQEKSPWDDPRLPWTGKPGKADIACWAAIVGSGLYLLAILPFRAALVGTHPVIAELTNGSTESVIAAAAFARVGKGSLVLAILVAFPGLMKFDLVWWWAGRLWGERVIGVIAGRRRKTAEKHLARVHRWGWRFSWPAVVVSPFLPIPNTIIYAIVGVAGMRLVTFIILDIIGTALWVGLLIGLGYEIGHPAVAIAQKISHYSLWISLGIVAVVVAGQFWGSRRKS